ncbi:MAG: phospho-N-acetylmuramoyl-pentapeptide-transferase [Phycisphaeraceae bacterium]|nr:MAG: phospho-N-acetylmuramoyl-pentapeptide-transferase [Phycisphaeraceae bacterium]
MLYLLLRTFDRWLDERGAYGIFGLLDQIEFRGLAAAGLAFMIVLVSGRRTIAWLRRKKIGDGGLTDAAALTAQAASKANVPTMGGVLIVGAAFVATFLLADLRAFYIQVGLLVMVCFAGIGAADDWLKLTALRRGSGSRQGLYAWEKLAFQLGIAALVAIACWRHDGGPLTHVLNIPFQRTYVPGSDALTPEPGLWYLVMPAFVVLTTLMIAGLSNAVNITDGMDGLAAGISGVVCVGLFILCLIAGSVELSRVLLIPNIEASAELCVLTGALGGACLGFLWWNCSPASVFMGDTGALSIGAVIGYVAAVTRQEVIVLLMCGMFVVEAASVMIQVGYFKATGGKRIFRIAPYHHNLHLQGWTEQQVVVRFWIVTILLLVVALASIKVR